MFALVGQGQQFLLQHSIKFFSEEIKRFIYGKVVETKEIIPILLTLHLLNCG